MKALRLFASLLIVALLAGTAFAGTKTKDGVTMQDKVTVSSTDLLLNGMGTREATIAYIDVYVAGLYLEARSTDGAAIAKSTTKKQLVLHFVRDVDRSDIMTAWNDGFENNAPGGKAAFQAKITQLNGWMRDMKSGQKLTFTYVKDSGVEINVNGTRMGTIPGDDFAEAFFLIWLGKKPPNAGLKKGLLGQE